MLVVVLTLYLPFHVREGRGALVFQLDMMMVVEREALREVSGQPALGVKPGYSGGARLLPSCIGRMSELASAVMIAADSLTPNHRVALCETGLLSRTSEVQRALP